MLRFNGKVSTRIYLCSRYEVKFDLVQSHDFSYQFTIVSKHLPLEKFLMICNKNKIKIFKFSNLHLTNYIYI